MGKPIYTLQAGISTFLSGYLNLEKPAILVLAQSMILISLTEV